MLIIFYKVLLADLSCVKKKKQTQTLFKQSGAFSENDGKDDWCSSVCERFLSLKETIHN